MAEHFAGNAIPGEKGTFTPPILTADQKHRLERYNRMVTQANTIGYKPWSVINIAPFTVNPPNIKLFGLQIPSVPISEELWNGAPKIELRSGISLPFTQWVCTTPQHDVCQQVHGMTDEEFTATTDNLTWFPEQITADIVLCNNQQEMRGGVWRYEGAHEPLSDSKTREKELDLLQEAYDNLLKYCEKQFIFADQAMGSMNDNLRKQVRPLHRWCTWYLLRVNSLKEPPKWLSEIRTANQAAPVYCEKCGIKQENPRAPVCSECAYIRHPYEALTAGIVDLETPGAKAALRRCSKKQLQDLGLYPAIKPLGEYLREIGKQLKEEKE